MRSSSLRYLTLGLLALGSAWAQDSTCTSRDFESVLLDVIIEACNDFAKTFIDFEFDIEGESYGHDHDCSHFTASQISAYTTSAVISSSVWSTTSANSPSISPFSSPTYSPTLSTTTSFTSTSPIPVIPTGSKSSVDTHSPLTTTAATNNAPSPTTLSSVTSSKQSSAAPSGFCYGVNLGGWLVLEPWMLPDVFTGAFSSANDQWSFDLIPGAETALQKHWSTYITHDTIKAVAATGINCLRIPIGFWAYKTYDTTYIQGADAWLEKAVEWARSEGMRVWIDCHGSPGSQNGLEHSGHVTDVAWQRSDNLQHSIDVLTTIVAKYGGMNYSNVVSGIELTNEPATAGNNIFSTTQSWTKQAFDALKPLIANPSLEVVMHDAWMGPSNWETVADSLGPNFALDVHEYQLYTDSDKKLDQAQHITKACGWASDLAAGDARMSVYVGEWSAAMDICVNADGSTTAGTTCTSDGCQCQSAAMNTWNDALMEKTREYVEVQMQVFEKNTRGYFMWSVNGPGVWGFLAGIEKGIIPNPVTKYKYANRCGS